MRSIALLLAASICVAQPAPKVKAIRAARMLDVKSGSYVAIGSIEAGKFADIIAVAGDPLTDVGELRKVTFVMKGGEVIKK